MGLTQEEFVAPKAPDQTIIPKPLPPQPRWDGVIAKAFEVKQPWQLINPFAPKEYGNGQDAVTHGFNDPEKPKGIIIFGIEW